MLSRVINVSVVMETPSCYGDTSPFSRLLVFFFLVSPVFLQRNRRNDDDSLLISSRVSTTIGPEKKTGEKEKEKEGDGGSR